MDKNNKETFEMDNISADEKLNIKDKCLMAMSGVFAAIILVSVLLFGAATFIDDGCSGSAVPNFRVTNGTDVY